MSFYLFELLLLKMCRVIGGEAYGWAFWDGEKDWKAVVHFVWFSVYSWPYDAGVALPKAAVAILKSGVGYSGVSQLLTKQKPQIASLWLSVHNLKRALVCSLLMKEHSNILSLILSLYLLLMPSLHFVAMCHHDLPSHWEGTAGNCGGWGYACSLISCQECSIENAPLLWWVHPHSPVLGSRRPRSL